ncbi:MAG: altronate dehydratase family protein [Eubacteriales bacterium]|nr:altronate dehydratase family protein [Eubacteriales bacterium]
MKKGLQIDPRDTVIVALEPIKKGEKIKAGENILTVNQDVPQAHKVAVTDMPVGTQIYKYGQNIGVATEPIKKGDWIHDHNIITCADETLEYKYEPKHDNLIVPPEKATGTFQGYKRKGQYAGIRNYIAIIPLVYCCNGPIEKLARIANEVMPKDENFDGFLPLPHECGCSSSGEDLQRTAKLLAGVAENPNMGGVLFVSLGCEVSNWDVVKQYVQDLDDKRMKIVKFQDVEDEMATGLQLCKELYEVVSRDKRETLSFDRLGIGLNCGGSDGFSGITANPLVGRLTDRMVSDGATVVMTEVSEMIGAERILMDCAKDQEVHQGIVEMINGYKEYFKRYGVGVNDNATQGNKTGGLSTIEDKSLGCTQKSGRCMVMDALPYGGRLRRNGFVLFTGPGCDLVCITGMVAAGTVLTVFTTGRGTPSGFAGPLYRISTNNELYQRKPYWNDFNAGRIVDGEEWEPLTEELYQSVMDTINGKRKTCNEKNGFYQMGFLRDGATH